MSRQRGCYRADVCRCYRLRAAVLAGAFFAAAFLAGSLLRRSLLAGAFLAGAFLAGAFLAGAFLAGAFFAAVFLAGAFLAAVFLAACLLGRASSSREPSWRLSCGLRSSLEPWLLLPLGLRMSGCREPTATDMTTQRRRQSQVLMSLHLQRHDLDQLCTNACRVSGGLSRAVLRPRPEESAQPVTASSRHDVSVQMRHALAHDVVDRHERALRVECRREGSSDALHGVKERFRLRPTPAASPRGRAARRAHDP